MSLRSTSLRVFGAFHESLVDRGELFLDPIEDLYPSIVVEFLDARNALEAGVVILVLATNLVGGVSLGAEHAKAEEFHILHHFVLVDLAEILLERPAQLMVL